MVGMKEIEIEVLNVFLKDLGSRMGKVGERKSGRGGVMGILFDRWWDEKEGKEDYEWIYVFDDYCVWL